MSNSRFEKLRLTSTLNGIDFVEVSDDGMELTVNFVRSLRVSDLTVDDFAIEGGERIRNVGPLALSAGAGTYQLKITVARRGDFSTYTLLLQPTNPAIDAVFDPVFRKASFSFRASCPSEFDCQDDSICAEAEPQEPPIDYLARDYATIRRVMLDRMTTLLPDWRERNVADPGVALVEAIAYVADRLSYRQDAIATEAYLGTARNRISVRRHARLVDYSMHDGRNARAFVQMQVSADIVAGLPPVGTPIYIHREDLPVHVDPIDVEETVSAFETMEMPRSLFLAHNRIVLHDWGMEDATLDQGATKATLKGPLPELQAGDWLMFAEVKGPNTGNSEDADPAKRHPVRLTKVTPATDPLATPTSVVAVEWHAEDAMPFTLCLSNRVESDSGSRLIEGIGQAWGNLVLADHGRTLPSVGLDPLLSKTHPALAHVAQIPPLPTVSESARAAIALAGTALPATTLTDEDGNVWAPRRDLIASGPDALDYVLEVDQRSVGHLRFGDGVNGRKPATTFGLVARRGNGRAGNIPAGSLYHFGWSDSRIVSVWNPLAAVGGEDPETIEHVRQTAPFAFRTNKRAVTEDDYAFYAGLHPEVQRAAARFRWTGSWRTVFMLVDRRGGQVIDEAFAESLKDFLEPYRMAGHDLEVRGPRSVPLELELSVCARPERRNEDIAREVRRALMPFFDADALTFGQAVRLSPLVAAAQNIAGVHHVTVVKFQRQNLPSAVPLSEGFLSLDPLEVARLDDDPDFPERGKLTIRVEGGQ